MATFHKRLAALAVCVSTVGFVAFPQSPSAEFNKFRQKVLSDYQDFKSRILAHYADFLDGEWHEFEPILVKEDRLPKPTEPLTVSSQNVYIPEDEALAIGNMKENALLGVIKADQVVSEPPRKVDLFGPGNKSNYEIAAAKIPDPGFAFGPYNGQMKAPEPGDAWIATPGQLGDVKFKYKKTNGKTGEKQNATAIKPTLANAGIPNTQAGGNGFFDNSRPTGDRFNFDFYGMEANIPDWSFNILDNLTDYFKEAGDNWKLMDSQKGAIETARQLFGLAQNMGLNGYLTYRLAEHYVKAKFPDATALARMSAVHYLLSQMGYDARLAELGRQYPFIMLPFDQAQVFGERFITFDGSDRRYMLMTPLDEPETFFTDKMKMGYYTCSLPAGDAGKTSDLRLTGLNLPMKGKPFQISGGGLTLQGEVNENFMKMLYRYPQMPIGDFASSWLDNDLRKDLILQVRMQLDGLSEEDAVNKLMGLFHYGFDYATDQANFGFEKPYFLEENLYYDKNDCEDRAMFFSYLVWNVLDLPCELLQYSNHESTSVASSDNVTGYYYLRDGKKYYSADPTYMGSHWGMIAKPYDSESPNIDKVYN